MKTILIYTSGTLGDHLPFIALGQALTARGYRVRMAINQAMHTYAHRAGLDAVALTDIERGEDQARQHAWAWNHWNNPDVSAHPQADLIDRATYAARAQELINLCQEADLLIATSIRLLGYIAHSALELPWLTVSMNPYTFWQPASADERRDLEKHRAQEYLDLQELIAHTFAHLGIERASPPWSSGWPFARHVILASSPHFSRPDLNQLQPRSSIDMTGFWFYQDPDWQDWQPDDQLRQFCQRRPIVLSFSSLPVENPRQILSTHVEAAAQLERPLLVQRGWAGFSAEDLPANADPSNILFTDFIPHDWLFAQAACSIQHGGIGSIARALRQGCPLLIEPFGNDQIYNAARVADLGVGAVMHPFELTARDLTRVLRDKVLTPAYRQRAQDIGAKIQEENGLETACQFIETYLERQPSPDAAEEQAASPYVLPLDHDATPGPPAPAPSQRAPAAKIPQILHQTWKDKDIPPNLRSFHQSWQTHHPDWTLYLWTDADNRAFLQRYYPWFLPIYDSYPEHIMRVDAVRYFILYHYGGLYVDLDFECLRPLEPLLDGKQILFGIEPADHIDFHFPQVRPFEQIVSNALIASLPGHSFWPHLFQQLLTYHQLPDPLDATGPFLLSRSCATFPQPETIHIEPAAVLFPITQVESQQRITQDPTVRERIEEKAYAIHHWHCTWWNETTQERARQVDVTLLSQGEPISATTLLALEKDRQQLAQAENPPRISCVMITRDQPDLAQRAVRCFQHQIYPNRELIIVDDGEGNTLEQWVTQLDDAPILYIRPPERGNSPQELWQMALQRASGDYVAQWNDNNLSDPRRLETQLVALMGLQAEACLLERQQIWWPVSRRLATSYASIWPESFLCTKASLLGDPDDEAPPRTIAHVMAEATIALLDFPQLTTYLFDETNPTATHQWETLWLTAGVSYEGKLYEIMIQKLQNYLDVDLSPWMDAPSLVGPGERGLLSQRGVGIPRILHQTWKDDQLPPDFVPFQQSWQANHPDWTYHLWTDVENREFLRQHYAWFLPIYDGYPEHIMRVDAVRYFILYHYGGVYADLDFESLQPLEPLLSDKQLVFGLEPEAHLNLHFAQERSMDKIICNAFMASAPRHPFWEHLFQQLIAHHKAPGPLDATGPFLLTRSYDTFDHPETIHIVPEEHLYPISSQEPWQELPAERRNHIAQTAYAVHHWWGSWYQEAIPEQVEQIKATLLLEGKPTYAAAMQLGPSRDLLAQATDLPCISCLMVTRNRLSLTQRSIRCFQQQTYTNKELVIIDDGQDDALQEWVTQLDDPQITLIRLPDEGKRLGELRNLAVKHASGEYVAQWDDDDLSDPRRLEIQMAAIHTLQAEACFLERHMLWWPESRRLAVSDQRIWESSFVCAKEQLPPYPSWRQGEDTPVAQQIAFEKRVVVLDFPRLYLYVFHGENTFDEGHWDAHWLTATESFEGPMYDAMLSEIAKHLKIDLVPWSGHRTTVGEPDTAEPSPTQLPSVDTGPATLREERRTMPSSTAQEDKRGSLSSTWGPKILVLTPVKDATPYLPHFWEQLRTLTYPHHLISLAFLESDSIDGTYELISENLPALQKEFAQVKLFKRDYAYRSTLPRWEPSQQYQRRSIMAKSRNHLLAQALGEEDWVLWIDVDVAHWPCDVIEQFLITGKEILVPNCLSKHTGETFDYNTFKLKPGAEHLDWSPHIIDNILQPPKGFGRLYLSDLRQHDCVQVDAVGGTMLMIRADIHREGLVFPTFSYKLHIETEGLALMARDMGYTCWGLPNLEILHP